MFQLEKEWIGIENVVFGLGILDPTWNIGYSDRAWKTLDLAWKIQHPDPVLEGKKVNKSLLVFRSLQ